MKTGVPHVALSIVIVSWNTRDLLHRCLLTLAQSTSSGKGSPTEVLVVDNASSDGSTAMIQEQFPWVKLAANRENVGFARANNQAIRQCKGQYILLLNSDTEVLPGALERLVGFMDAHHLAGAVGARLLNADGSLQPSCHPMLTPWREFWRLTFLDYFIHKATYGANTWKVQTPQRVEVIKGACLLLRRQALDEVGLLDESYFMYTEEVDLCYRLARAGWQLWWVPAATVVHHGEASTRQVAQDMYLQLYRSKIQFYRKFGGKARADHFKRLLYLAYWPRLAFATLGALCSPFLAVRARTYRRLLAGLPEM